MFNKGRDNPSLQVLKEMPQCELPHKGRPCSLLNSLRLSNQKECRTNTGFDWPSSSAEPQRRNNVYDARSTDLYRRRYLGYAAPWVAQEVCI